MNCGELNTQAAKWCKFQVSQSMPHAAQQQKLAAMGPGLAIWDDQSVNQLNRLSKRLPDNWFFDCLLDGYANWLWSWDWWKFAIDLFSLCRHLVIAKQTSAGVDDTNSFEKMLVFYHFLVITLKEFICSIVTWYIFVSLLSLTDLCKL